MYYQTTSKLRSKSILQIYAVVFGLILLTVVSCKSIGKGKSTSNSIGKAPNVNNALKNDAPSNVVVVGGLDTMRTASGLKYIVFRHKGGSEKPNYADKVYVHYKGYLADGSLFSDSYTGEPFAFQLGMRKVIRGWDEGIALLSVGDSALLVIPPGMGYGDTERGGVPANSTLYYYVEILKVTEPVFVNEFIWQNKQQHATASGLKYYIVKEGYGKPAFPGANVKVHYTGYTSDGRMFESTVLNEAPLEFQIGSSLPGLNEGILMMKQGAKYRFILPPSLAYGEAGSGDGRINPNATLIFDCELLEVK